MSVPIVTAIVLIMEPDWHCRKDLPQATMIDPHFLGYLEGIDKDALTSFDSISQHVQKLEPGGILKIAKVHVKAEIEVGIGNIAR